jgi:hypothetical protein
MMKNPRDAVTPSPSLVILSEAPYRTVRGEAKDLCISLRVNSAKDLALKPLAVRDSSSVRRLATSSE